MKLRNNRLEWVRQRRRQLAWDAEINADDDGMSRGIIPFGAILQWQSIEEHRLTVALAAPLTGRITGWDATGVGIAVLCPYCRTEHRHILCAEFIGPPPEQQLEATCGRGIYRVRL